MNFKQFQTEQKLRGGYYTSDDLAEFLVRWVSISDPKKILEPSCGDGVFLQKIAADMRDATVTGIEINSKEAMKSEQRARDFGLTDYEILNEDFLGWAIESISSGQQKYDAVLGNPPFIRYQFLPPLFQSRAEKVFGDLGCRFTRHTNAWVPFVLASFALLHPGGRLAMVVPAEIIHVMHAQSLRTYLGENARRMTIVDPKEIWFSDTLQGAVLLLAEKKRHKGERFEGIGIYPVQTREFVNKDPEWVFGAPHPINGKAVKDKWTRALLDSSTRILLEELGNLKAVRKFSTIAEVDVGIVTGANRFFLVSDATIRRFELETWAHPMFGRSEHCPGIIYDSAQHQENAEKGLPTNFVWFQNSEVEKDPSALTYIRLGEHEKLNERFKCRSRKPWYAVPSVYATEVGMLKRSHEMPRLIFNQLRAFTTDTSYRIRVSEGTVHQLVYNFINPLTALSAELEGRHYGGGVLELVPSEIERLLIPVSTNRNPDVRELDMLIRNQPIGDVLEYQSRKKLGPLGISAANQDQLLMGWQRLRDRRQRVSTRQL